mmetsp:Transcript_94108/g.272007  ORF Transcript_94108/g.272007 Transcript_94108/m.272007 type:complete len:213 (+) Transcript_94108:275-913(+)
MVVNGPSTDIQELCQLHSKFPCEYHAKKKSIPDKEKLSLPLCKAGSRGKDQPLGWLVEVFLHPFSVLLLGGGGLNKGMDNSIKVTLVIVGECNRLFLEMWMIVHLLWIESVRHTLTVDCWECFIVGCCCSVGNRGGIRKRMGGLRRGGWWAILPWLLSWGKTSRFSDRFRSFFLWRTHQEVSIITTCFVELLFNVCSKSFLGRCHGGGGRCS